MSALRSFVLVAVISGPLLAAEPPAQQHWSLQPIMRPTVPQASDNRTSHPVDRFVRSRLEAEGIAPNQEADRRTLARRLSFDLLGLPPTPDVVTQFVNDHRPDAYERLVDRFLASPRFGERMAQHWLDLARYADSDGYHDDTNRAMWPYRDWVIQAFNDNQPFDDFTIDQLAGDLRPNATLAQRVATAFHRNNATSNEEGANPDEYMARYAVDRVNTTATVWLGLTLQCVECHDHKYDPFTTREYYQLFAFFNQVPEEPLFRGLYAPPAIEVPTEPLLAERDRLNAAITAKREQLKQAESQRDSDQLAWEKRFRVLQGREFGRDGLVAEFLFAGEELLASSGSRQTPAKLRPSVAGIEPHVTDGLLDPALRFSGEGGVIDAGQLFEFKRYSEFSLATLVKYHGKGGCVISKVDPQRHSRGVDVSIEYDRVVVRLIHRWPQAAIKVATSKKLSPDRWYQIDVSYNGTPDAQGIYIHVNGQPQELAVDHNAELTGSIRNSQPVLIGGGEGVRPFDGVIDDVRFHKTPLSYYELLGTLYSRLASIVGIPAEERTDEQTTFLTQFFREHVHRPTLTLQGEITAIEEQLTTLIPKVRVMRDVPQRRETFVLVRGDFRTPGEQVHPGTPRALPPLPALSDTTSEYTRLDLARWLVSPDQPLTARVTVNRLWAMLFGPGIVTTPDDFGTRGARPSHPELLDWLAAEFISSGWDVKALLRTMVTSATYRQSSSASAEQWLRDPENRLLARGPRKRLPAEFLRDNALAISGLLSHRIGGPSAKPYQAPGLWRDMSRADNEKKAYIQDHGEDLYRRGLYTFWKRSIHYPTFAIFDAPSREVCTASRPITNTPLQALTTFNDLTFVEAARVFAERILRHAPPSFDERLEFAYQLALARPPRAAEAATLRQAHADFVTAYRQDRDASHDIIASGEYPREPTRLPRVELAAWTALAQILLNLDETLTKE